MYNLLRFLKKYYYVLLFLILEVICILLIVNSLPYQKRKFVNAGNKISGGFFKTKTNLTDYFCLKKDNQRLVEQNALLLSKLYNDTKDIDTIVVIENDYIFIPARVINNDIYHTHNFILLDKGKKHGIEKNMGVICENGIVGKVVNVSENYASVISMLHPYSVVSARFVNNKHIANVKWDMRDYRYGVLKDIPLHLELKKGDTLVTSGFSFIYPPEIMIGTIQEMLETDTRDFNTARIQFSTNFSTLSNVYVIKNINQTEIDSLTSLN